MKINYLNLCIETERLIIRPLELMDFDAFQHSFASRNPKQNEFDSDDIDVSHYTPETFSEVIQTFTQLAESDESYIFSIFLKTTGELLGKVEFSTLCRELTGDINWGVLGYIIHNQHWGHGYGSEAVRAAIPFAMQHLHYHRIEAHITPTNTRSIKVAEHVELKYECTRERFIREDDQWIDKCIYSITAP
ncbi:N-acetyltransferase [Macrococcus hajekii]|uniref:N-acetyltransferase n=1 Tax=Macrococcus hajekii TaxID=198482 RepID=A0A4R6BJH4_9STAP|nr:GNAT family N-acetyltransferase [Macrococcus hajekii]TDM01736.1 N-acetyltransferase [Macrococcus hajekii]GGB06961.1 N-acetyltransferase [Macrococcus hajekii]